MAYQRINWRDEVVERPRTYNETTNSDGSKTFTDAPGEIIEYGTPLSATNFNKSEEALQHLSVAFDLLCTTYQAEMREMQKRLTTIEAQLDALA